MPNIALRKWLAALLLQAAPWSIALSQQTAAYIVNDDPNDGFSTGLSISEPGVPGCGDFKFSQVPSSWPMNSPGGDDSGSLPYYFTLPGTPDGQGNSVFHMQVDMPLTHPASGPNDDFTFQLLVDGQLCSTCQVTYALSTVNPPPPPNWYAGIPGFVPGYWLLLPTIRGTLTVTHQAGDAWASNGVRHFAIRTLMNGQAMGDIRFHAVMTGVHLTPLGHFAAPQAPDYILRDPPGDQSYTQLESGNSYCYGETFSTSDANGTSAFAKVKVGVETSVFGTPVDIGVSAGVTASREETSEANKEYRTCLNAQQTFTTAQTGGPDDDLFIGSAVEYAYGVSKTITRPDCGTVMKTSPLTIVPVGVNSTFAYTASQIQNIVIPQTQVSIASLTQGTPAYKQAVNQLSVWQQMLDMDNALKAAALGTTPSYELFSGGGSTSSFTETITTSATRSLDMKVELDAGLSAEFSADVGGNAVAAGGEITVKHEVGSGQNASNESSTTHTIIFSDGQTDNHFEVPVYQDAVYGAPVFGPLDDNSRTSCPYEGGYALDQPVLSVNALGTTFMALSNVTIGGAAIFPLIIHNNSDAERTYYLKLNATTNTAGAIMNAFGNPLNAGGNGVELDLLAGATLNVDLTLTQPNVSVLDFANIGLYLYSLCDPSIQSGITITAHFGGSAPVDYCEPSSANGPSQGDWVDGVQIGAINNTGSGGDASTSYVNYTGQYSTVLPRNSEQLITITSGVYNGDSYAAWIDFNGDGTFDAPEKLGEFVSNGSFTPGNIPFTVPAGATLGTTRMRVRGTWPHEAGEPDPLLPCYNYIWGETEDYAVVITDDVPQDCQGTPNGSALPGSACDDGDGSTGNDTWNANCTCIGQPLDCAGVPGGNSQPGSSCDDGNNNTTGDTYGNDCSCTGLLVDCTGFPNGTALPGTSCDDGDASTGNDVYGNDCTCAGLLIDCTGNPGGGALPGSGCDDGNPLSADDAYSADCNCVGTLVEDCLGTVGGSAQPGTACDDGDQQTGNDVYQANCLCVGQPFDCNGQPGGPALPGASCNDFNPQTDNDVWTSGCVCQGSLASSDCLGVPGGTAQPGTSCDDGNSNTGSDVFNAFCQCAGQPIDCNGIPGGPAQPGSACDDGNAATGNDVITGGCQCVGSLIDCQNIPGGSALPGSSCDDGDPDSDNDAYNANCVCVGVLASDCAGVPGGNAQPGTACDDGNADTGNDVYLVNCQCAGQLIDCIGTIGGGLLPGTACDDGEVCTIGELWTADCICVGNMITIGSVSGPGMVDAGSSVTCYITPVAGATGYSWTLPGDWTSDNTSAFVLVAQAGQATGTVNVCVDATVGDCVLSSCLPVQVMGPNSIASAAPKSDEWFTLQPNPSNGVFQLLPSSNDNTPIAITIHDGTGRQVMDAFSVVGQRAIPIDLGNVAPGAYYLLATRNGQHQAMKVMVQH